MSPNKLWLLETHSFHVHHRQICRKPNSKWVLNCSVWLQWYSNREKLRWMPVYWWIWIPGANCQSLYSISLMTYLLYWVVRGWLKNIGVCIIYICCSWKTNYNIVFRTCLLRYLQIVPHACFCAYCFCFKFRKWWIIKQLFLHSTLKLKQNYLHKEFKCLLTFFTQPLQYTKVNVRLLYYKNDLKWLLLD